MKQKLYFLPKGKHGIFEPTGEFREVVAITKTQLLNEAGSKTLSQPAKNKRRLRESLVFRPVKGYKSWNQFIGNCEMIEHDSVSGISLKGIISRALESRGVEEPCIAVFRMNGQSFVYTERGKPVIYNGRLFIERGGSWYREEDNEGNIVNWYLEDRDADRTMENEYLLTESIPFPNDMDDAWQKICTERYGQICDKYHIVPEPISTKAVKFTAFFLPIFLNIFYEAL